MGVTELVELTDTVSVAGVVLGEDDCDGVTELDNEAMGEVGLVGLDDAVFELDTPLV